MLANATALTLVVQRSHGALLPMRSHERPHRRTLAHGFSFESSAITILCQVAQVHAAIALLSVIVSGALTSHNTLHRISDNAGLVTPVDSRPIARESSLAMLSDAIREVMSTRVVGGKMPTLETILHTMRHGHQHA